MADKARLIKKIILDNFHDEGVSTETSLDQLETERSIQNLFNAFDTLCELDPTVPILNRDKHLSFLRKSLSNLSDSYKILDCSRPWLCYWILNSLYLLNDTFSDELVHKVSDFLSRCQNEDGGFGGGPGQLSHLAPTYAAVNALCTLGTEVAYKVINREALVAFLSRVKHVGTGAFAMHEGGEEDIRGVYCALSVAILTNTYSDELFANTPEWIASCQSYEGGFSGVPGMEAHGGYSFCGLASAALLKKLHLVDARALLRWCVNRQMKLEGGFQGRTNKLVDGCYSYWQGGAFPILHELLSKTDATPEEDGRWLFHQEALQEYILICCQYPNGGLIDKPSKNRDLYHTCYNLSGLSISQWSEKKIVIGSASNLLAPINVLFNIGQELATKAANFFRQLPVPEPFT